MQIEVTVFLPVVGEHTTVFEDVERDKILSFDGLRGEGGFLCSWSEVLKED